MAWTPLTVTAFVGPLLFTVAMVLLLVLVVAVLRVVLALAWKLVLIGLFVVGIVWVFTATRVGPLPI